METDEIERETEGQRERERERDRDRDRGKAVFIEYAFWPRPREAGIACSEITELVIERL